MSGFPNKVVALQFEWQWQNSQKSRVTKKRKSIEKNKKGGYKVSLKVLHSLMETTLWKQLNLHVHFLDENKMKIFRTFFAPVNGDSNRIDSSYGDNSFTEYPVTTLNTISDFETMHEYKNKGNRTFSHKVFLMSTR